MDRRGSERTSGSLSSTVVALTGLAGLAGLSVLSGCSSNTPTPQPTVTVTTTTTATPTFTGVPPASSGPGSSTTASPTSSAASGAGTACRASQVELTLDDGNGAAGHIVYTLTATNKGATTCTLQGYPGVSLVTGPTGQQLGAAAVRTGAATPLVSVGPAGKSTASVQLTQPANLPNCGVTAAAGWRFYLPGETNAQFVPATVSGCSNGAVTYLQVQPFQVSAP